MGALTKELFLMWMACIPIILFQTTFLQRGGPILAAAVALEVLIVGSGSLLVWKLGGFANVVTKVREITRVWDYSPETQQKPQPTMQPKFCRYCGTKLTREGSRCEKCDRELMQRPR